MIKLLPSSNFQHRGEKFERFTSRFLCDVFNSRYSVGGEREREKKAAWISAKKHQINKHRLKLWKKHWEREKENMLYGYSPS